MLWAVLGALVVGFLLGRVTRQVAVHQSALPRIEELYADVERDVDVSGWATVEPLERRFNGTPRRVTRKRDGAEMVLVPKGRFWMGCSEAVAHSMGPGADDGPHAVELTRSYYMDVHEVTCKMFEVFVEATRYRTDAERGKAWVPQKAGKTRADTATRWDWRGLMEGEDPVRWADYPVVLVTWNDAHAYALWAGAELPTEAQFERAQRTIFRFSDWPWPLAATEDIHRLGNAKYDDDGFAARAPVGSFPANEFGLFDLPGNAWEWCTDEWEPRSATRAVLGDPVGSGKSKGVRGGGWDEYVTGFRCGTRSELSSDHADAETGFRLVRRAE